MTMLVMITMNVNNDDKNPHHHCYKCRFPSSPITPKSWTLPKAPLLVADTSRVLLLAFHHVDGHNGDGHCKGGPACSLNIVFSKLLLLV